MQNENMPRAIMLESLAPLRAEPKHAAEQTTELLFGERVEMLETEGSWTKIKSKEDGYLGWLPTTMLTPLENETILWEQEPYYIQPLFAAVRATTNQGIENYAADIPVCRSARFYPDVTQETDFTFAFTAGQTTYSIPKALVLPKQEGDVNIILTRALEYVHCPYRWGGKTLLGIDCSGLVQVCFAIVGIHTPRDASQQALFGFEKKYELRQPADLAFFVNDAGKIGHVGILLDENRIIHAAGSGRVRIDNITPEGIIIPIGKTLTHRLHSIRGFRL